MNLRLKKTNVESLIFFDAEMSSRNKELDINSKEFELFEWFLRDKVTGDVPDANVVQQTYKNTAALKAEFNRVVCISVGFVSNHTLYIKTFKGEQKDVIRRFYNVLRDSPNLMPTGYNIIGFDLPTIRLKAFEEGVDINIPDKFVDSGKKPWTISDAVLDLMDIMKGTFFNNISLDNACHMGGVPSPKEGSISGPKVSEAFWDGRIDEIASYCERDVEATVRLFLKMAGSSYEIKEVVIKEDVEQVTVKTPLITRIFEKGQIDPEDVDELIALSREMGDLDKDRLCTILTGVLLSKEKKTLDTDELLVLEKIKAK